MTDDHDAADAGTKLSPELRDLAAAVKAIERGEKPAAPAPRRAAAPEAPAVPVPAAPAAPAPAAAEPPRARPVIPSSADALSDARAVPK